MFKLHNKNVQTHHHRSSIMDHKILTRLFIDSHATWDKNQYAKPSSEHLNVPHQILKFLYSPCTSLIIEIAAYSTNCMLLTFITQHTHTMTARNPSTTTPISHNINHWQLKWVTLIILLQCNFRLGNAGPGIHVAPNKSHSPKHPCRPSTFVPSPGLYECDKEFKVLTRSPNFLDHKACLIAGGPALQVVSVWMVCVKRHRFECHNQCFPSRILNRNEMINVIHFNFQGFFNVFIVLYMVCTPWL